MKYNIFKLFISIITLLFAVSCNMGPKPENIAEDFLKAYFAADYENAAKYCTPALEQDLLDALEEMNALNEEIRENIKRHTQYYAPQIKSAEAAGDDSVTVYYNIVNTAADSLATSNLVKESKLDIVKTEEGWKVSALK